MKKIISYMYIVVGLASFVVAIDMELDNPSKEHKTEMSTINGKETLTNQRDERQSDKQDIKDELLKLYQQLRKEDEKETKKEIKHQISELKRELWTTNSKIAQSYKQNLKGFLKK